jgi:hypothetical protein
MYELIDLAYIYTDAAGMKDVMYMFENKQIKLADVIEIILEHNQLDVYFTSEERQLFSRLVYHYNEERE